MTNLGTLAHRLAFLPIVLLAGQAAAQSSFQGIGFLAGNQFGHTSEATGLSADGAVAVGFSTSAIQREPFRWTAAKGAVGLGFAGFAQGVSGDGKLVVGDDGARAFVWSDPKKGGQGKVDLGDLPGGFVGAIASGISGDGSVAVGQSSSLKGFEAFRWTSGGMVGLGDIAGGDFESCAMGTNQDGSVIVGWGTDAMGDYEAFVWTDPAKDGVGLIGLGDLPGGAMGSSAGGVSADGLTVVGWADSAGGREAFRWTKETGMIGLGDLPGGAFSSIAHAASADGSIIVGQGSVVGGMEAFVWTAAAGMVPLSEILESDGIDLSGWILRSAGAISADGRTIAGVGDHGGLLEAFIATIPPMGGDCYADFTGDGALDLFDFLAFVNLFNAADPAADCDGTGTLDLFDFLCFTNAFNAGCV